MSELASMMSAARNQRWNSHPRRTESMAQAIYENHINGNHSEVAELVQGVSPGQLIRITRWLLSEDGGAMEVEKALRMLELAAEKEI